MTELKTKFVKTILTPMDKLAQLGQTPFWPLHNFGKLKNAFKLKI